MSAWPEIPEAAATGEIAALYDDMRAVMRIASVNLVYRHLATVPGALGWVWSTLRPHAAAGTIDTLAATIAAAALDGPWPLAPRAALAADERAAIAPVIASYHRSNTTNLVALRALRLGSTVANATPAATLADDAPLPPPLPPPIPLASIEPALRERIVLVAERQGLTERGITPTLYLHLARWPRALATILDAVAAAIDEGAFGRSTAAVAAAGDAAARRLSPAAGDAPSPAARAAVERAIDTFTATAIPQMIALGARLTEGEALGGAPEKRS